MKAVKVPKLIFSRVQRRSGVGLFRVCSEEFGEFNLMFLKRSDAVVIYRRSDELSSFLSVWNFCFGDDFTPDDFESHLVNNRPCLRIAARAFRTGIWDEVKGHRLQENLEIEAKYEFLDFKLNASFILLINHIQKLAIRLSKNLELEESWEKTTTPDIY